MSQNSLSLVRIEFQRVQSFLFAAPRLRDMVGANVLLGEVLRNDLARLANGFSPATTQGFELELPSHDSSDPLDEVADPEDRDDPRALYHRGILARDGGHFHAIFASAKNAENFRRGAEKLLRTQLPGLRFSIDISPLVDPLRRRPPPAAEHAMLDLPQFQVCQATGNGPAEETDPLPDGLELISRPVKIRREAYRRFQEQKPKLARDIISLIDASLPHHKDNPPADDFQALCGNDYIAVIHADGNAIGKNSERARGEKIQPATDEQVLAREARGESFFHATRIAVRKSVAAGLEETFGPPGAEKFGELYEEWWKEHRPYQLLMLGGDDLLLVCRAKAAMQFIIEYARAIAAECESWDEWRRLTIGAGIVIAPPSMPFHHLHRLAETLARSAKRLYYRMEKEGRPASVVDWLVASGSWTDDPIALRRRDGLIRCEATNGLETLALSRRPLPILGKKDSTFNSLEALVEGARNMQDAVRRKRDGAPDGLARSQLRGMVDELRRGRKWSDALFAEMDDRDVLKNEVGLDKLWLSANGNRWLSPLPDLVEIFEVGNLSTKRNA